MKHRVLENCPVCKKLAVYIDVELIPAEEEGSYSFKIEPGIIACAECKVDLELFVCDCSRHELRPL